MDGWTIHWNSYLSLAGHEDSNPVASNNTATGRAKNRRVEIVVL